MNFRFLNKWEMALIGGAFAYFMALPQGSAELVLEEDGNDWVEVSEAPQSLSNVSYAQKEDQEKKADLLRRARMRQEIKNEDHLQERLESLRLRDEKKREKEIGRLGEEHSDYSHPVQTETIEVKASAPVAIKNEIHTDSDPFERKSKHLRGTVFSVSPKFGISNMYSDDSYYYEIDPKYSAGFSIGVSPSDHITVEAGYLFNEYGVSMTSSNPYVRQVQQYYSFYDADYESASLKQNIFEAGIKAHLTKRSSVLRPFVGAGGGYSLGYLNYDEKILNELRRVGLSRLDDDYEIDSFLGHLSAGLDVNLSKNISVGATFKYYKVLSSDEKGNVNNAAVGYRGRYPYYGARSFSHRRRPFRDDKQIVGGSLAESSFYSILGGLTFSF